MLDAALKAIGAGLVGTVLGWSANSLTMDGRVSAIESALVRIESRLDTITLKGTRP